MESNEVFLSPGVFLSVEILRRGVNRRTDTGGTMRSYDHRPQYGHNIAIYAHTIIVDGHIMAIYGHVMALHGHVWPYGNNTGLYSHTMHRPLLARGTKAA